MYNDTKKYLKKYWRQLVLILITLVVSSALLIAFFFYSSFKLQQYYKTDNALLSVCSEIIYDFSTYTKEQKEKNHDIFSGVFAWDQKLDLENGCKFNKVEIANGLDKIFELNKKEINSYVQLNRLRYLYFDLIDLVNEDTNISDADFLIKYKASSSIYLSEQDYSQIKSKHEFLLAMYEVDLEKVDELASFKNIVKQKINNEEVKTSLEKAANATAKNDLYLAKDYLIICICAYLLLSFVLFRLRKILKNDKFKIIILTISFSFLIVSLFFVFLYLMAFIFNV